LSLSATIDSPLSLKDHGYQSQQTLKASISCTGTGVHTGMPVTLKLCPAEAGTGIVFRRVDLDPIMEVQARWDNVIDTRLCTVLGLEGQPLVGTVEHLMAALAGCQIDNAVIEIDGPEVPIMDGSSEPFVFLIECAGIAAQTAIRTAIKILKPITLQDGEKRVTLRPAASFSLGFEIKFDTAIVGKQRHITHLAADNFKHELSRARTFGFLHEVNALRQVGLARGGSLENAVVIDGDAVMNQDGLRFKNEFVRHKILDAVGDLYLAGKPLLGHFEGVRSGHALNNQLLRALFAQPDAWLEVEMPAEHVAVIWQQSRIAARA
jgi:UDP-3-O-[3-hydroxymyristoyl] N-acetylglucosamine deacetylase